MVPASKAGTSRIYLERSKLSFKCPACGHAHDISVAPDMWEWNKNWDSPSISPSVMVYVNDKYVCHSFIQNGTIQYLKDSTHVLVNKTILLPVWADA